MSHMTPLVSVVIPAHNARHWVTQAVASALGQSHKSVEVLVVDDGSTDDTAERAGSVSKCVRVIRQEQRGPASARNVGITESRGEFVAFLDADDLWDQDKLEAQLRLFAENADLCWAYAGVREGSEMPDGSIRVTKSKRHQPRGDVLTELVVQDFVPTLTVIVRREALCEAGGFDESPLLLATEDWDLWLRLAERYPVDRVRRPLGTYRHHSANTSKVQNFECRLQSSLQIVEGALQRNSVRLSSVANRARAECYRRAAYYQAGGGLFDECRRNLAIADKVGGPRLFDLAVWTATSLPPAIALRIVGARAALRRFQTRFLANRFR